MKKYQLLSSSFTVLILKFVTKIYLKIETNNFYLHLFEFLTFFLYCDLLIF
nr:MAG TPA: hypothetical protein [Caudoviricetes sp.]